MTQETAKERTYREALEILRGMGINSKNRVMMPYGVAVTAQEFIEEKLEDAENMPSTTDKLSVEKLIEKEIKGYEVSYKISGRRSENYIAGILEGLKIARAYVIDSLRTDEKTAEKLQEQLNTAKKALTEAIEDIEQLNGNDDTIKYYKQALAAIGGDDE